jgi:hypothetical protein
MKRRVLKKSIAIFLLLITIGNVMAPTVSWALTSGPTAPEATSFEPVDTTDMVNLLSGDMIYNVPLLEVPGPSGGYPLSLSYHAGIQPGEDASWTGLGWTLNPGSIYRSVNGFADDHDGVNTSDRVYWSGGTTDTYSVGVSVGISGLASVEAGLAYSVDTYKGVGVGGYVGAAFGPRGLRASASVGINPYGGGYLSAGLSSSFPLGKATGLAGKLHVGFTTNFQSISYYGGANVDASWKRSIDGDPKHDKTMSFSPLGVSMASGGGGAVSMTVGGISAHVNNSKIGKISTSSDGFSIGIPITPIVSITFSEEHVRYWMDETENVNTYGSLFTPRSSVADFDLNAYDSYSLQDPFVNPIDQPDPTFTNGASYINYDDYFVNAQGLGGNMRPYSYKELIFRQNKKKYNEDTKELTQYAYAAGDYRNTKFEFRFKNDFSNRYISNSEDWLGSSTLTAAFGSVVIGEPDGSIDPVVPIIGNKLAGSRNVEWFTNNQILNNQTSGLIETSSTGFDRATVITSEPITLSENRSLTNVSNSNAGSQIGGFKITNESGVTYHFSLPAYAYDEYQYSVNITQADGETFNEFKKPAKYAYTWYLTAVTGPDFVDRGSSGSPDGKFGDDDWGYWVEFQYGKWTGNYAWRTPERGFTPDIDNNFKNYSSGKKEVYYLDAVKTKTHTAIFVKDARYDGKGTAVPFNLQEKSDLGFESTVYTPKNSTTPTRTYPVSSLSLKKILLFENKKLDNKLSQLGHSKIEEIKSISNLLDFSVSTDVNVACPLLCAPIMQTETIEFHSSDNVYDVADIANISSQLEGIALRTIDFAYDYSLCPETENSINPSDIYLTDPASGLSRYGKLTLTSLTFNGKGGVSGLIPPMKFYYDLDNPVTGSSQLTAADVYGNFHFSKTNSGLKAGDILKFKSSSAADCYALVISISGGNHYIKIVGKNPPAGGQDISWQTTKNPPYDRELRDEWGLYKPDYTSTTDKIASRKVTSASAPSTDVWSLRKITSSLGSEINIEYEPDDYSKAILQNNKQSLSVNYITRLEETVPNPDDPANPLLVFLLDINTEGKPLGNLYSVGDYLYCTLGGVYDYGHIGYYLPTEASTGKIIELNSNTGQLKLAIYGLDPTTILETGIVYYPIIKELGGGLRVKSVSVNENITGIIHKTNYDYSYYGEGYNGSSGVTSYVPDVFDKVTQISSTDAVNKLVKRTINSRLADVLRSSREVPSPGVMYGYVTVSESIDSGQGEILSPTRSQFSFQMFDQSMIGFSQPSQGAAKHIILKDYTAWIGKLKSITLFDASGLPVSKTTNNYLHDYDPLLGPGIDYETKLQKYFQQGEIQETSWDARYVKDPKTNVTSLFKIVSKRQTYPAIQTGQTNINYKTGIATSTQNLSFDFYSGQVTSTLSSDGYGNSYLSTSVPAYRKYGGMGLAINGGANMLTQEAANYTYKVEPSNTNNHIGLVSASAQTWSNNTEVISVGATGSSGVQPNIWRTQASYSFIGDDNIPLQTDGLYPMSSFAEFNAWTSSTSLPNTWQKNTEITLYDPYSNALEASDINGNFAATVMTLDQTRVSATAANCKFNDIGYSGAEEQPKVNLYDNSLNDLGENIYTPVTNGATRSQEMAHTGTSSLLASVGQQAFLFSTVAQINAYHVSVWCSRADAKISYKSGSNIYTAVTKNQGGAGGWYLVEADIQNVNGNGLKIWCEAASASTYFDDFRVHPINSSMTSYVYNEWGELSHILNTNNLFTSYDYDAMGRLVGTSQETFSNGITPASTTAYHYANH